MEDENIIKYDEIDARNKTESKSFIPDNEEVFYSGFVKKINKYKVPQKRILVITNKYLYNIAPNNHLLSSITHWLAPNSALKRKIPVSKISEITISTHEHSGQFIIHVEGEYDYRYDGDSKRSKIVEALMSAYFTSGNSLFSMYLKDSKDLLAFHTTDDDFKAKIIKRPSLGKVIVTPQLLKKGLEHIIDNKETFMVRGGPEMDLNKAQSEIREKRSETFGSYHGPPMNQSTVPWNSGFDREKHINTIDDIPMCESGVIIRKK